MNAQTHISSRHLWRALVAIGAVAIVCCLPGSHLVWAATDSSASTTAATEEKADRSVDKKNKESDSSPDSDAAKVAKESGIGSSAASSTEPSSNNVKVGASTANTKADKPEDAEKQKEADRKGSKADEEKTKAAKHDKVRLALLTLKDALPETNAELGPFGEAFMDLREVVNRLKKAADDDSVAGVILDIQSPEVGRGKVEELRAAIHRFRKGGKKIYAQLESAMPADYLIACACDEIILPEAGVIVLPGIHAEATFYKGLLNKVGIQADFIHMGAYKGAAEPLTRDKFSDPVRENMTTLIDSLYDDMVSTIVKERPLSIAQAKEAIDRGLLTATRAKELGLIDRVAYADTLKEELAVAHDAKSLVYVKNYGQKEVDTDFSGPMGFFKLMQAMMGGGTSSGRGRGKKIAIVYAVGPITTGKSQSSPLGGSVLGSTTIVEALRDANDDKQVAAIVLRIDSPGGSALASDLIWHETQVIEKPIVASMGDVAGSGGYYIAMGCDRIIATPGTVTGSIGVVGGKLAIRGLYEKLGVTTETIERGKNSGIFSSSGPFTDSQRTVVTEMMEDIYRQFTTKAAEGRKMPVETLRELAGGRVYTGTQAKDNGLIDELGTLHDAIAQAKQLAGLEKDADVRIEVLPEPTNFFESLFGDLSKEEEVRLSQRLESMAPELAEIARQAYRLRAVFDGPAALVMPFQLDIR